LKGKGGVAPYWKFIKTKRQSTNNSSRREKRNKEDKQDYIWSSN
jgi:ribosomal protein L39E